MRFDLVDLQLFIAVADQRSITRGAERSNLALASASARICCSTRLHRRLAAVRSASPGSACAASVGVASMIWLAISTSVSLRVSERTSMLQVPRATAGSAPASAKANSQGSARVTRFASVGSSSRARSAKLSIRATAGLLAGLPAQLLFSG